MRWLLVTGLLLISALVQAGEQVHRFNLRVGAMFANQIKSGFQINSRTYPLLGVYIDTDNTLGMLNSETVPMFNLSYLIKGNHLISVGAFRLKREATKQVSDSIDLGDIVIPVGAELYSFINTEYLKVKYNYVFFDHPRVKLTVGVGLHLTNIDLGLTSKGIIDAQLGTSGVLPLPVFGGAMVYTLTEKLRFAVRLDEFYVKYGNYAGTMTETNAALEYQAFKRIGFGFGLTRFMLDADLDDEEWYARINNSYQGFSFYTAFRF